jgi:hypothetical protein
MRIWKHRIRLFALTAASGAMFALGGCGLTDQQLASIWASVITTGLNTLVTNALSTAVNTATTAA